MDETLRTILDRRSVRKFTSEQVKEEELQTILEAARYAPTAMGQQPWHFTVVQSAEMLGRINETCRAAALKAGSKQLAERAKSDSFSVFYNAPTFIIVTADSKAIAPQNDGTLALGNMLLAAEALGVSACWIHALKMVFAAAEGAALKDALGIPEGYEFVGAAAFGYRDMEKPKALPRKDGVVNFIR